MKHVDASRLFLCLFVLCSGCAPMPEPLRDPEPERRIEIAIRDHAYVLIKPLPIRMGTPTVITIRNEDEVAHGFVSPMLVGVSARMEGDGVAVRTEDEEGFHVDPGKTLMIYFTPDRLGTLPFRCDIHPAMKEKELLYLDIRPSRHR